MKNYKTTIIISATLVRILMAIPMIYVSIEKFAQMGRIESLIMGIGLICVFEFALILSSLLSVEARSSNLFGLANFMLILSLVLAALASYTIQNLSISLHVLNFVSLIFMESIGFFNAQIKELEEYNANMERIKADYQAERALKLKILESKAADSVSNEIKEQKQDLKAIAVNSSNESSNKMEELIAQGIKPAEIAIQLDVDVSTVYRRITKLKQSS